MLLNKFAYPKNIVGMAMALFIIASPTFAQEKLSSSHSFARTISTIKTEFIGQKDSSAPNLYNTVLDLAKTERLTVVFDDHVVTNAKNTLVEASVSNLTSLNAIKVLLEANSLTYTPLGRRTILILPRSNAINPYISLEEIVRKANRYEEKSKTTTLGEKIFAKHDYNFTDVPLAVVINTIAQQEKLNVIIDDALTKLVETKKISFSAKGTSSPNALSSLLNSQRLLYIQGGERTILIRAAALANYIPSNSLEEIIIEAEENEALGIQ